ncbi:hypothetical protein K7X08_037947 [Anisodus acutangulus]|uniref:Uncharacterized protein n=1 Tax=Anisodus acutangulus TaxID=402998 RepID=A0A9Q1RTR4_9SOLA|nr:hypothetical protein K7X08_037947 [Anisodus acutangulus]
MTQNQLIHCLLLREVVPGEERELWIKLNGCVLSFGIGEFVVITDLKMMSLSMTNQYQLFRQVLARAWIQKFRRREEHYEEEGSSPLKFD